MPTRPHVPILVVLALLTAWAIAGCGSGGGTEAAVFAQGDGPVTKERFLAQADALCQRTSTIVHGGLKPYVEEGAEAVTRPGVAQGMVHDVVAPDLETLVFAIAALEWPTGDEAEIGAVLAAIQEAAAAGRADPSELISHHERVLAKAADRAESYGLTDCGKLWIDLPSPDAEADETGEEDKDEFVENADEFCRRATAIVQEGMLPYVEMGTRVIRRPAVVAKIARDVIALELEAQNGWIQALEWPADDGRQLEALLESLQEVADRGRERPSAIVFHPDRAFAHARRLAEDYGFSYCGKLWIVLPNANSEAHVRLAGNRVS